MTQQNKVALDKAALLKRYLQKTVVDQPIVARDAAWVELPLSYPQQSLWFLSQMVPDNPFYNIPSAVEINGNLDVLALRQTFATLIERHEALRTTFPAKQGKPWQQIDNDPALFFIEKDFSAEDNAKIKVHKQATLDSLEAFDLAQGPLIKIYLYRLSERQHWLLFVTHHIISDGWSLGLIMTEMQHLYRAYLNNKKNPLPALPVQFADYALWLREKLTGDHLKTLLKFWQKQLTGHQRLRWPTDHPRPEIQSFHGATEYINFPDSLGKRLEHLGDTQDVTLFMILLSTFKLLLSRYSRQHDIIIGTPVANRNQREIEGVIGFFANSLVLRTDLSGDPSFIELLQRVKKMTLQAYAHQSIPFEMLVEKLNIERKTSFNPLFQIMFSLQGSSVNELELAGLQLSAQNLANSTTHFDMEMHLWNKGHHLGGYLSYNKDLFEQTTIKRLLSHYWQLLLAVSEQPQKSISQYSMQSAPEIAWLLQKKPASQKSLSPILTQIIHHAKSSPEVTAVAMAGHLLTYAELNAKRLQWISLIDNKGLPSHCIIVYFNNTPDRIAAILAVLSLDYHLLILDRPLANINQVISDAHCQILLTDETDLNAFPNEIEIIHINHLNTNIAVHSGTPSTQLNCLIYSASQHTIQSDLALLHNIQILDTELNLAPDMRVMSFASPEQNEYLSLILWTLHSTAQLILNDDPHQCVPSQAINYCYINVMQWYKLLHATETKPVQAIPRTHILCGAGLLHNTLVKRAIEKNYQMTYLYRPPESQQIVSLNACQANQWQPFVDAGKRLYTSIYIINDEQLVPIGVVGQIYLSHQTNTQLPPMKELIATGEQGLWSGEGCLQLIDHCANQFWYAGKRVQFRQIIENLLHYPALSAGHIILRRHHTQLEMVLYFVAKKPYQWEKLKQYYDPLYPLLFVEVNRLPLDARGHIDEQKLLTLSVIDTFLVTQWQKEISEHKSIDKIKVIASEVSPSSPRLHISELLSTNRTLLKDTLYPSIIKQNPEQTISKKKAYCNGGQLSIPESMPITLDKALQKTVNNYPTHTITVFQKLNQQSMSYLELEKEAFLMLAGLQHYGLKANDKVILQIDNMADYFPLFWACILGGIIPVTVSIATSYEEPNSVLSKLCNTWKLLDNALILTNDSMLENLTSVHRLYPDICHSQALKVLAIETLEKQLTPLKKHTCQASDIAFLQLTSGSTGIPKCIQISHQNIVSHIIGAQQYNHYENANISLNWLPMDHVVPLLTCHLKDVYLGINQIHIKTDIILSDPLKWLDYCHDHRVSHTWAPNFAYKLVNDALITKDTPQRWDLSSMKSFMNAGEQVIGSVIDNFIQHLTSYGVTEMMMQPAFGMAEASTCMTYQNEFKYQSGVLQDTFTDLGGPVPGVEIRICDPLNHLLTEGVIGRLQIKGKVITPGYFNNDIANKESFVGDGWFNTGDQGFILAGRLAVTGREKEIIIVRGANFFCYEIEAVVNDIKAIESTFVACHAVHNPDTGSEGLAIYFVAKAGAFNGSLIQNIRQTVSKSLGITPQIILPLEKKQFPKTTSGKIQRNRLKKELEAGKYNDLIKKMDILLENSHTIPDWFYQRSWQREHLQTLSKIAGRSLLFIDQLGLGEALAKHLKQVTLVTHGNTYERINDNLYQINPQRPEDYLHLIATQSEHKLPLTAVIHLWTYSQTTKIKSAEQLYQAQYWGLFSLLYLVQAMEKKIPQQRLLLLAVSSASQSILANDPTDYRHSTLHGLSQTINQEMQALTCRHIDLSLTESIQQNTQHLIAELTNHCAEENIAYRNNERWVSRLQKATLKPQSTSFIKVNGTYVITGGLGGLGRVISEQLLRHYQVRLIIIGRRTLKAMRGKQSELILQQLQKLGEVIYIQADISQLTGLKEKIAQACRQIGHKVDAFIHLAGLFMPRLLTQESAEMWQTMQAKIQGAWNLDKIATTYHAKTLHISSVNAFFGGVSAGAYSAANAFLHSYSQYQREQGQESYCFAFSLWDETGMSKNNPFQKQTKALGYHVISPKQGVNSLLAGIQSHHPELFIGLDASKANVRRMVDEKVYACQQLRAYYTEHEENTQISLERIQVQDRYAIHSMCEFIALPEMPLTKEGQIDVQKLQQKDPKQKKKNPLIAAKTSLEKTIAEIWKESLQLENISVLDSFFELGGQSILLVQVHNKLQQVLDKKITITQLLRYPTISALAKYLGEDNDKPSYSGAQSRAQKQKLSRKRRIIRKGTR